MTDCTALESRGMSCGNKVRVRNGWMLHAARKYAVDATPSNLTRKFLLSKDGGGYKQYGFSWYSGLPSAQEHTHTHVRRNAPDVPLPLPIGPLLLMGLEAAKHSAPGNVMLG